MELYRYLIDDFLFKYCQNLKHNDLIIKTENGTRKKLKNENISTIKKYLESKNCVIEKDAVNLFKEYVI